ncbi:hypothetical protein G8C41_06345 [Apibacter sp. B3706]|uniref:hypothetical protein n=1 Tax=Apibacter sp. B3706 TaxID=2656760 RepID=UPI001409343B|nr:hypothetical protein [Apibacter sp. B3706]QII70449.1 hypothetical protein G8C41_06345 [Apibacter sp. B3706]
MKKLMLLFLLMVIIYSCSDSDTNDLNLTTDQNLIENPTFSIKFVKASNGSTMNNLQVGDSLVLTYKITGATIKPDEAFTIMPQPGGPISHQLLGEDYDLYFKNKKVDNIYTVENEGKFTLYIKKAGNFSHTYCAFIVNAKNNEIPKKLISKSELFFNSVRIVAYNYEIRLRKSSTWHHSLNGVFHKLYIDTGNEVYDKYLENLSYNVYYNSRSFEQSNFRNKENRDFYDVQKVEGGKRAYIINTIDKIIFKKDVNGIITNIEYKNIPVVSYGRKDDWGTEGNNNL